MPTSSGGATERDRIAREVISLQQRASLTLGPIQKYEENPFYVFNPTPHDFITIWSLSEFINRRKNQGYQVVTPERALKHYQIPESEIDKAKGYALRGGLILMEVSPALHARAKAIPILRAIEDVDADLRAFIAKMGGDAREVDHQRGVVKRNKKGMLSSDEKAALRMKRLEMQIRRDAARQANVTVATQGTLERQLRTDPDLFAPQGRTLVDHGNFKEVVLTEDPSRDLEDFE